MRNSADLVATLCARAGLTVPWSLHGRDLAPLLRDPDTTAWSHPMLMENLGDHYGPETRTIPTGPALTANGGVPWWVLLRDGRYKYIRTLVAGELEELYDLDADPEELHNLAVMPEQAARLATLRSRTLAELRRTEAPFAHDLPPVRTSGR